MNDTINLELNLPVIGGTLTAFFQYKWDKQFEAFLIAYPEFKDKLMMNSPEYDKFFEQSDRKYYDPEWKIKFTIHSHDRRYNGGYTLIFSDQDQYGNRKTFDKFCEAFEEALKKMKTIENQSFEGTYKKSVGGDGRPNLEVVAENGKVITNFWISSNTTSFAHELDIKTTEQIVEKLKEIPDKALNLMISLEELTS